MAAENGPKIKLPRGLTGFFARLRDTGTLARMPAGWVKVMLALYSRRNPQGYAWPSQRTLAEDAGVHRRTVRRFIAWGRAALGIRVTRKKGNSYYLPLDEKIENWFPEGKKRRPKGTAGAPKELRAEKPKIRPSPGQGDTRVPFYREKGTPVSLSKGTAGAPKES